MPSSGQEQKAIIVAELLREAGLTCNLVTNEKECHLVFWKKLLVNSVMNPLTSLYRVTNGQLLEKEEIKSLIRKIVTEVVDVAKHSGVELGPIETALETVNNTIVATSKNTSSMFSDILKGRSTEIGQINGYIVEQASKLGISVPMNSFLVDAIRNLERINEFSSSAAGASSSSSSTPTTFNSISHLRDHLKQFRFGEDKDKKTIGLVPTMGALHNGHLKLVEEALKNCDVVVVSIFVNPQQFAPHEDFDSYPRTLSSDLSLLSSMKRDASKTLLVFNPSVKEMYPIKQVVKVNLDGIDTKGEGASRPGFFRGVSTVCSKLFNVVQPHSVFFGQKDGLQCIVIRRLIEELNFPIEMNIVETVRESDGLAMSSRNVYLTKEDRAAAPQIYKALSSAQSLLKKNDGSKNILAGEVKTMIMKQLLDEPRFKEICYVSIADSVTADEVPYDCVISPKQQQTSSQQFYLISVAVRVVSGTKLIDNFLI
jgi:pantoate--beta-alanine ligase